MNALSGRIHQWSPEGGRRQEKLWLVGFLTHVVCYSKVIQEQKLSCYCTSSICKAVWWNREKYAACDTMHNTFRLMFNLMFKFCNIAELKTHKNSHTPAHTVICLIHHADRYSLTYVFPEKEHLDMDITNLH